MRTKTFLIGLLCLVAFSVLVVVFNNQRPATIQNFVSTTHQQLRNFKDTLRDAETKSFVADEKYLTQLGLGADAPVYPENVWHNTSLPVVVTYVMEGQESQAVGLINNVARILPNCTVLVYNLGLGNYGLRTLLNYCNSSHCQVVTFSLNEFPSHVQDDNFHAFRPIIIQDALRHVGAVLFVECNKRLGRHVTAHKVALLLEATAAGSGVVAWPMASKNAVSSLTHKKMFEYFRTDTDNFLFVPMVSADVLLIINTRAIHLEVMLPWVQCALTHDCIVPIGAQSGGCRFDKKPQYRYSGCHSYDTSALNIILGIKFKLDNARYTYQSDRRGGDAYISFRTVPLERAVAILRGIEQNTTTATDGISGASSINDVELTSRTKK